MLYLQPEGLLEVGQGLFGSELVIEGFFHQLAEGRHVVFKDLKDIYVYVYAAIMCIHKHKCSLFYVRKYIPLMIILFLN